MAKVAKKAAPGLAFYNQNIAPVEGQKVAFRPVWCREHHVSGPWPCECPPGPQILALNSLADETNYGGARGGGKLQPLDSKVLTPNGWTTMGELKVGDTVSDPTTGGTCRVLQVFPQGEMDIFRVTFDDGATTEVGLEHLWTYKLPNHMRPRTKRSEQREYAKAELRQKELLDRWDTFTVGTTKNLIDALEDGCRARIPLTEPVAFTVNGRTGTGPVSPYLAGLMLGDAHLKTKTLTSCDDEIRDYVSRLGFVPGTGIHSDGKPKEWRANGEIRAALDRWLRCHGLLDCRSWEKFIPSYVFTADIEYRLEFLRGLMDTDGTAGDDGRASFCSTSRQLAEGVQSLVRSLGGKSRIRNKYPQYTLHGEKKDGRDAYEVSVQLPFTASVFKLSRKVAKAATKWNGGYELMRAVASIEFVGKKEARCIRVSNPYGLYITDDFIVTHNSEVALGFLIKGNPPEWCSDLPVDVSYVNSPKYRALILRESLVELEAFFDRACAMYEPMGAKSSKGSPYTIEWPSGAKFIFGYLADEKDVRKYLGPEYHRVVIEQAEQLASEEAYRALFGSMRSTVPGIHCQVFLTTNPGSGPGQAWIKRRFIDLYAKDGKKVPPKTMVRIKYVVDGQPIHKTRIFIPAGVRDNPYIKPEYLANLMDQPEHIRKAWLDGDWDATVGQFFPEFRDRRFEGEPSEALHVIPRDEMSLKAWWPRWMAMDWGYTHPTVVDFFCENPQSQQVNLYKELCFAKHSPQQAGVLIAETAIEDLRGLEEKVMVLAMSPDAFDEEEHSTAAQIQSGINSILGPGSCFIMKYDEHEKGLSPNEAWQSMLRRKQAQRSEYKIILIRANNKRIHGWNRLRDMFRWKPLHDAKNSVPDAAKANEILQTQGVIAYHKYISEFDSKAEVLPKLRIARECKATIESIKLMIFARSGTKLNTGDAEKIDGDDGADCCRYGVMAYEPSNRKQPEREYIEQRIQLHPGASVTTLIQASDELRHQYKQQNPGARAFTLRRAGRGVYSGEQNYAGVR